MNILIMAMGASASTPNLTVDVDGTTVALPADTVELGLFIYDLDEADQQIIADNFTDAIDAIADEAGDVTPGELHGIYQDLADNLSDDLGVVVGDAFLDLDAMNIVASAAETTSASAWHAEWGTPGVEGLLPVFQGEEPEPQYSLFSKTMALGGAIIGGALGMATGNPVAAGVGAAAGAKAGEAVGDAIENYAEGDGEEGGGDSEE